MSAPLQLIEATSWDFLSAAQIITRLDQGNVARWTGSVASMQTGHTGSGQCIRNPSSLTRTFVADRFTSVYARVFFRSSTPSVSQSIMTISDSTGTALNVALNASGIITILSGANSWTSTTALSAATWYQIEAMVYVNATEGAFEIRLNGVAVPGLEQSDVNTTGSGVGPPNRVVLNNASAGNADYDDLTIAVGFDGWSDSDWIGRTDGYPKIATLYPNEDGAFTGWIIGAGTGPELYKLVDEAPASTADFISSNGALAGVSFKLTELPAAAETALFVKSIAYSRGGGSQTMRHFLVQSGGNLSIRHRSADATMNSTWQFREREWPRNEREGRAWGSDAISSLQTGYRREQAPSTAIDIAQIAVEVLYNAADPADDQWKAPTLLRGGSHALAKCWRVTRTDGHVFRFAAHDKPLEVGGFTYDAIGGIENSASRAEGELKDKNQEFVGILSSDKITNDDLRAGRYRNAMVEEFLVNWRWPDAGRYNLHRYWVGETRWNGVTWTAQVNGHTHWLKQEIGATWGRMCRYQFGEPKCFYALHGATYHAVGVVGAIDPRTSFDASATDISATLANSHFKEGKLVWRSGANYAIVSTVRKYTDATKTFELHQALPFDIQAGDYFDVAPGCDLLSTTCLTTWDNYDNFGGEPHIPGTDSALATPSQ